MKRQLPAPVLVLASIVSVQFGGALAATLIPRIGALGSVALRLTLSALVLCAIARPRLCGRTRRDWAVVSAYAAALGCMNLSFYLSLARLPIGVAVTIEFVGPLVLSAALSRSVRDGLAVLAAAAGVTMVSGAVSAPLDRLDGLGVLLALAAGAMWACYILTSGWVGGRFAQLDGLAIALAMGACVLAPTALAVAGTPMWRPDALWRGAGIALLSSLIPYSLELLALRRMSAQVFGILLSGEPAVAALAGLLVLGQRLSWAQLAGMALVVSASVIVMGLGRGEREPTTAQETALIE